MTQSCSARQRRPDESLSNGSKAVQARLSDSVVLEGVERGSFLKFLAIRTSRRKQIAAKLEHQTGLTNTL